MQLQEGVNDLKFIVGEFSRMKNHMQTNKPLADIPTDGVGDEHMWNSCLQSDREVQKLSNDITAWFCSSWLLVECYFYRSIISAIRQRYELVRL
jgi:Damage-control phosphatase ARMT1-like domain